MSTRSGKVPPFVDEERERQIQKTRTSLASYVVMAFGWMLMTIAMVGGAYFIYSYLTRAPDAEAPSVQTPLIVLGLTYLAGWVVSLVSIRALYNLIMPVVIKVYSFGVLAGVLFVYGRGIYKIFNFQAGDPLEKLPGNHYLVVLMAGYVLLVSLYLLVSNFTLVPHAIILLVALFVHLVIMVYHYVFVGSAPGGLVSFDMYFLVTILVMALLLFQRRLYRPLKGTLANRFREKYR